ncbi:MAG: Gfo/Idh/MocA family oxidoreductase [SAR202 cluster bacterium]|nr:Gfo/Idh/MocA family oxidoreductase [SAR202 cluster bacterium]
MTESTHPKYRVGLIGCGLSGTTHARAYNENPSTVVVAAVDPDQANLDQFCQRFDSVQGYRTYDEMFANEDLDIVAPVLPVSINADAVVAAAKAGVSAIFCEKPIAASLQDADRMVEACLTEGVKFACGDAFRNLSQYWRAKEIFDSGDLGEIKTINLYDSTAEISGGGCQGLSLVRLFAQDADVDWVVGWVSDDPWSDDDQRMGGVIQFTNGVTAHVHEQSVAKRGIEVIAESGIFYSDHNSFRIWREVAQLTKTQPLQLEEDRDLLPQSDLFRTSYDSEGWRVTTQRTADSIQSIVDSLDHGIDPRCTGDNMRKVLEIAIGLRESHRQGHQPVKFPIQDRSLALYPRPSRWLNKKELLGESQYAETFEVIKKT